MIREVSCKFIICQKWLPHFCIVNGNNETTILMFLLSYYTPTLFPFREALTTPLLYTAACGLWLVAVLLTAPFLMFLLSAAKIVSACGFSLEAFIF